MEVSRGPVQSVFTHRVLAELNLFHSFILWLVLSFLLLGSLCKYDEDALLGLGRSTVTNSPGPIGPIYSLLVASMSACLSTTILMYFLSFVLTKPFSSEAKVKVSCVLLHRPFYFVRPPLRLKYEYKKWRINKHTN